MLNSSVTRYDAGVADGQNAARGTRRDNPAVGQGAMNPVAGTSSHLYQYHRMVVTSYDDGNLKLDDVAYSRGYCAGWVSISSGCIA
jgi:hypothetical protein